MKTCQGKITGSSVQKKRPSFAGSSIPFFILYFFILQSNIFSQATNPDISVSFIKPNAELQDAGSYFNVLKIENKSAKTVKGEVFFRYPESWVLIGANQSAFEVAPGQVAIVPFRASIPRNTVGGISYLVSGEIVTETGVKYAATYVSIKGRSKWDMKVLSKEVFLSNYHPVGDIGIRISNSGNINELIKMKLDIGGLLDVSSGSESDTVLFLEIPAYRDTTLILKIRKKTGLSYAESRALSKSWKSTSIYVEASTPDKNVYSGMRALPLESSYNNELPMKNSPLNLDLSLYNLLSSQKPKLSAKVHGKILFPEAQQVSYSFGIYNMYFNKDQNKKIDLNQQLKYMVSYSDQRTQVQIGDRMGTGTLHTLSGSGIQGQFSISDENLVYMNVIQNIFGNNYGVHLGYKTVIKQFSVSPGITLESTRDKQYSYYTFHLGGTYNFLSKHSLRLETASTLTHYNIASGSLSDTTNFGFAYRLGYNYNDKKFKFRLDNLNTRYTFLRNSGINRIDADGTYILNSSMRLQGLLYHNRYSASKYPYNFYHPVNMNSNDNGRIVLSYTKNNLVYQLGPQYFSTSREYYNIASNAHSKYVNIQPGIMGSVTIRLGGMRSISPNVALNTMKVKYTTDAADDRSFTSKGMYQYTAGINYYDESLKISAYYTSGEASDIYRSVIVDEKPVINQAIHFRPYYERYFKDETLRLSAYVNYSYYMPSQRENTIYNITSDFYLKHGWNLYMSFNMYKNARVDATYGRISLRELNMMVGFRYAFDIQQPRLKYYDLTLVGFNDVNGDGIREDNEKPVSNILIKISRDAKKNDNNKTGFTETSMITDVNGEIYYGNIPEGVYDLSITPLSNLADLYFLNGESQTIGIHKDGIVYLPLAESYKVMGKIIVDRDPNSNEGNISLEGIKVTAETAAGETYSVLTDGFGSYVLNLPHATTYKVYIYNVLGERFVLDRNEYEVQFSGNKTINLDFKFTEMKRGVRFNEGENHFDFNIKR